MFSLRSYAVVMGALLCLAFSGIVRADDIDNPEYKNWSKFKAGTSVKIHTESEAMGNKSVMDTTTTLKDITPEKATLETKTSMVAAGQTMDMPAQAREVAAKIAKPADAAAPAADAPKPDSGTEDVKVGDKTLSCKWVTATSSANGMNTTAKTWTCDDVPGGIVKMESNSTGAMTATVKMTLVELNIAN